MEDFLTVLGLPQDSVARTSKLYNRSWNEHVGELAHRVRDLFADQHDNQFFNDLHFAVGPAIYKDYSGSVLLTLGQRIGIVDAYAESNGRLRARHFPSIPADEPLFDPPTDDDVVSVTEMDRLRAQQDVLVRAVVGLAGRVRALEQEARSGPRRA